MRIQESKDNRQRADVEVFTTKDRSESVGIQHGTQLKFQAECVYVVNDCQHIRVPVVSVSSKASTRSTRHTDLNDERDWILDYV